MRQLLAALLLSSITAGTAHAQQSGCWGSQMQFGFQFSPQQFQTQPFMPQFQQFQPFVIPQTCPSCFAFSDFNGQVLPGFVQGGGPQFVPPVTLPQQIPPQFWNPQTFQNGFVGLSLCPNGRCGGLSVGIFRQRFR